MNLTSKYVFSFFLKIFKYQISNTLGLKNSNEKQRAYSEASRTSKKELFEKIVNGF